MLPSRRRLRLQGASGTRFEGIAGRLSRTIAQPHPRRFDEPIPLPKGKQLVTLRDAALHITKLPKAEHDAEEWLAAMEALLLVAETAVLQCSPV